MQNVIPLPEPRRLVDARNNHLCRIAAPTCWIAAVSAARKNSRGAAELRRMFAN